MPDLRDPIWQGWGAIFGLVFGLGAILVAIVAIWYQRGRKNLSYMVVSAAPLLSVQGEVKSRVEILFDGKPVESARLLILKFRNSGNTPIAPTDYVRPVSVKFPDETQLLDTEVLATEPKNLGVAIRVDEDQVVILDPILLNRRDSVTLKFMLARSTGAFEVDGRIIGVKQITPIDIRTYVLLRLLLFFALCVGFFLVLAISEQFLSGFWVWVAAIPMAIVWYFVVSRFVRLDLD